MTFSYNLPHTTLRDQVRFYAQDTVAGSALFQDEELDTLLLANDNDPRLAAADALEAYAGLLARNAIRYSVTGFSLDRTAMVNQMLAAATRLRESAEIPFEFESVADHYVDSAGVDRSNYMNSPPDGSAEGENPF
jgi:hypothetical protein